MVAKKIQCAKCRKKCSGNVLRYQERYYHIHCFDLDENKKQSTNNLQLPSSQSNSINSVDKMYNNNNIATSNHIHAKGDTICSKCSNKSSDYSASNLNKSTIASTGSPMNGSVDIKRPSKLPMSWYKVN